jgi:hypothetical protein
VAEAGGQALDVQCLELLPISTSTFVGREDELRAMANALDPRKPGQKGLVLYGMPGAGKTQLALHYIEKHHKLFSSIFWITASSAEATSSSFSEAARLVLSSWPSADLPNTYHEQDDQKRVVSRLRSTLHTTWLLVIDSADDLQEQDLTVCVPRCRHGSVLVTSIRRESVDVFGREGLELGSMDPESGKQLLLARLYKGDKAAPVMAEGRFPFSASLHLG